ncbi:MAG: type II toxin-antitoxin system HicA family toxin [Thermoanaerobaculia bacterium]
MSPVLPTVTAREVTRALERAGFVFRRQRGSHQIYQHTQTGKRVSVPVHRGISQGDPAPDLAGRGSVGRALFGADG